VRPYRPSRDPYDFIRTARSEGNTIVQSFHAEPPKRRGRLSPILRDVVALANENGGTIFIGLSADPKEEVRGVEDPATVCEELREDVARHVTPPLAITTDIGMTSGKQVVIVTVPAGLEKPYAVAPGNIYVRQEGETTLAMRDEIVELVRAGLEAERSVLPLLTNDVSEPPVEEPESAPRRRGRRRRSAHPEATSAESLAEPVVEPEAQPEPEEIPLPRTGVEIVESTERDGVVYHSMRDLRNLKVVHNVTRDSARALWRYAIIQKEQHPVREEEVTWHNGRGFWKSYKPRGASERFNLVYRDGDELRVFYGVTEDGLDSEWREVVPDIHLEG
jgi:hypothetical protein